jgi:hypothetical protein
VKDYYDIGDLAVDVVIALISDGLINNFEKVDGFWIESIIPTKWRTKNQKIYVFYNECYDNDEFCKDGWVEWGSYSISGNTLSVVVDEYRVAFTFSKDNLSANRGTLGTVYSADPALSGALGESNHWELTSGDVSSIGYNSVGFFVDWFWDLEWLLDGLDGGFNYYTIGSRLFFLEELWDMDYGSDYDFTLMRTVELEYNISTVNGVKTLTTSLVGPLGVLLSPDRWVYSDYDYYYSQAKSRLNKKAGGYGKNSLSSFSTRPTGAR